MSSCTYHALRSTGVLVLPLEKTLHDYMHWIKPNSGFVEMVDEQLMKEAKIDTVPEFQKCVFDI